MAMSQRANPATSSQPMFALGERNVERCSGVEVAAVSEVVVDVVAALPAVAVLVPEPAFETVEITVLVVLGPHAVISEHAARAPIQRFMRGAYPCRTSRPTRATDALRTNASAVG